MKARSRSRFPATYLISKTLLAIGICSLLMVAGCVSVTKRSYNQPAKYVSFATVEACAAAGFEDGPAADVGGGVEVAGERSILFGFLLGQGGERVKVDIREYGPRTNVDIESRKRAVGFACQRHQNERIASYLDSYLQENEVIRGPILEGK